MRDTSEFAESIVKFYRRLAISEQEGASESAPAQSLVNIPGKVIESVIGLIYTKQFNTSFFTKELGLQAHVVDFIQILGKLKVAKKQERAALYESLPKNQSCLKALKELKIDEKHFLAVFRLFYNDLDESVLGDLLKLVAFNSPNSQADKLVQLVGELQGSGPESWKMLNQIIGSSPLLSSMPGISRQKKLADPWLKATKVLAQGNFDMIPELIETELVHYRFMFQFSGNQQDYYEMLQGLAGVISANDNRQYNMDNTNTHLSVKELMSLIYRQIREEVVFRKGAEAQKLIRPAPNTQWALYNLTKQLQINPFWVLILSGDTDAWGYLQQSWIAESNRTNALKNPFLVYVLV